MARLGKGKLFLIIPLTAVALAAAFYFFRPGYAGIRAGKPDANYIPSTACFGCHKDHYASWDRTHHSDMTQIASPESVLADFSQSFEYQGIKTETERLGDEYFITFRYPDGRVERNKIKYTIGSRRYQEYAAEKDGKTIRLPVHWLIGEKRWVPMNTAFFYADDRPFDASRAQWDMNCVFCHNVKAQPNLNLKTFEAKTEVAELGIACGACHGQGAEHADAMSSPFAAFRRSGDKKIVHPDKLEPLRSMMICGHCHGQRIPEPQDRITEIMTKGDPFNAGDDLSKFYRPVHAELKIGNVDFGSRFWPDGSIRLTAYEYQGILKSPCFLKGGGKITCISCHSMHAGDVNGQITEEMRGNKACTSCHGQLENEKALTEHTKHSAASQGSNCYSCHMPETVYGVMAFHKSHQISVPQPRLTAAKSVPNACNQCHADRSLNWAVRTSDLLWNRKADAASGIGDENFNFPETVRGLFAGDSLTRALMADAMAKRSAPEFYAPYLIEAFAGDNYPIVRYFAANGLAATGWPLPKPDYLADAETRRRQLEPWRAKAGTGTDAAAVAGKLRRSRRETDLEIGE